MLTSPLDVTSILALFKDTARAPALAFKCPPRMFKEASLKVASAVTDSSSLDPELIVTWLPELDENFEFPLAVIPATEFDVRDAPAVPKYAESTERSRDPISVRDVPAEERIEEPAVVNEAPVLTVATFPAPRYTFALWVRAIVPLLITDRVPPSMLATAKLWGAKVPLRSKVELVSLRVEARLKVESTWSVEEVTARELDPDTAS